MKNSVPSRFISNDRVVIIGGIAFITVISWGYMLWMATSAGIRGMGAMAPGAAQWSVLYGITMLVMWVVMMIAMMAPSAGRWC